MTSFVFPVTAEQFDAVLAHGTFHCVAATREPIHCNRCLLQYRNAAISHGGIDLCLPCAHALIEEKQYTMRQREFQQGFGGTGNRMTLYRRRNAMAPGGDEWVTVRLKSSGDADGNSGGSGGGGGSAAKKAKKQPINLFEED